MPKSLTNAQSDKLNKMDVSRSVKVMMRRHASERDRSVAHNDEMLRQLAKGKSVAVAHNIAVKRVGV